MFTIIPMCGPGNVLKSFITALSISKNTNIVCTNVHHPTNYSEIFEDSQICHGSNEYGESFASCRFLILSSESNEQKHLENELNAPDSLIDIPNKGLHYLFAPKAIDWFYDRTLICDKVYNRIMSGINRIKWKSKILLEVEKIKQTFIHPVLTINIRTWMHKYDPPGLLNRTDEPCRRLYNFETYKSAIEKFLPSCKTILLSSDNESVLPEYLEFLKDYNVIIYKQKQEITDLQYSFINMLISSKCDFMVCSRLSTFAECIWWLSECKQSVIPLY